jgi:4-hydroxybenzoate polyprenyltransferase
MNALVSYSERVPAPTSVAAGLFRSCHPLPSAAVTAFATTLAVAAGNRAGACVLVALAVLAGQLSVGWSNDRIDAVRDRRVEHEGKPVAAGDVPLGAVDAALAVSVVATVALSLLLGWRAGGVHLVAVAVAWAYNAGLKSTAVSWLPYGIAFGALPAVATLARPGSPAPQWWIVLAAALLGISVNFVNAKQALARDPRSDVRGLPDRIGGRASLVVAALLVAGCSALITWAPAGGPRPVAEAGAAVTAALLAIGLPLFWRRADDRTAFYGLLVLAPVQLIVLVATARPFT